MSASSQFLANLSGSFFFIGLLLLGGSCWNHLQAIRNNKAIEQNSASWSQLLWKSGVILVLIGFVLLWALTPAIFSGCGQ